MWTSQERNQNVNPDYFSKQCQRQRLAFQSPPKPADGEGETWSEVV